MVRIIGGLVGLAFAFALLLGVGGTVLGMINDPAPETAEHAFYKHPKKVSFSFNGPAGQFDNRQLQRGFQVYKEVCAACHSINLVSFRDLAQLGYSEAEVKAIASQWATQVPDVNPETGEAATRAPTPNDRFPLVYPNDVAARAANNNAIPPDLSLMAKARHDGPAYIYSLLTGYEAQQPAELVKKFPGAVTPPGLHYNPYFPNLNIAMPPPIITDGQVTYADGTKATTRQMARDVSAFLMWTAEPNLPARHRTGWAALAFLLIFTGLTYGAYRNIWKGVKE
jgi:ubiquinol-cytochrome c reductase cytochrome c1 subunit